MTSVSSSAQDTINRAVYHSSGVYRYYLATSLTLAERACLCEYHSSIAGKDLLDVGVGAGRTSRHLAPIARRYEAIDYSSVMVDYMKEAMPHVSTHHADFQNLKIFPNHSFDFVLATDNVIDALSHEGRLSALREACRVLRPGGILGFSSHNLGYRFAASAPRFSGSANPVRLAKASAKFALSWWNHVRTARWREIGEGYAILNDPGHFYRCLHYYAHQATTRAQLEDCGMRLEQVYDIQGLPAPEGDVDGSSCLMYVARRLGS